MQIRIHAFNAELAKYPGGVQFVKDGKTYGFYANGKIYLNASYFGTKIGLNTTIHEFAHPAVIETKRANPALYKRGMDLIVDTDYYKAVSEAPDYAGKSEEDKREEALVRLLSDRLENIKAKVPAKIYKEIENFVKEFWKRFGDVNGIRDLTPAMIDTMTVEDVADAIGAEMMYSDDFGFAHPFRDRAADERIKSEFDPRNPTKLVDSMNPVQRNKHLGLHRFLDLHDDQYPALHFYLSHHHAIFPGLSRNDQLEDYIRNLPNDDKMFLLGKKTRRHGDSSLVVRDYLNQFHGPADDWQDSDIMSAQDLAEQALQEHHAYRVWKNKGDLTPDEERELDYYNNFIAQGHTPEEYDQHLRDLMLDEDDPKFSRGGIFTGTAADYDKPSLHYVGTGEGSQVYGWGLYGSTVRGVAEKYAMPSGLEIRRHGNIVKPWNDKIAGLIRNNFSSRNPIESALKEAKENGWDQKDIESLENGDYEVVASHSNLYEQTFFTDRAPGDESHLLKWYEDLPKEQVDWIAQEFAKEGFFVASFSKLKGWTVLDRASGKKLSVWDKRESGETYEAIASFLGSPQAASEFLARAGIDGVKYPVDSYGGKGVKDGDEAGWNYVSFRDDNIRVDHKWTDGKIRFARGGVQRLSVSITKQVRDATTVNPQGATKETALAALKAIANKPLKNDETNIEAWINAVQRNKILSSAALAKSKANGFSVREHNAAAAIIDKLWKYAHLVKSAPDRDGDKNIKSIKRFTAPLFFPDKDATAYLTVKESIRDGHRIYSLEVEKLEAAEHSPTASTPVQNGREGLSSGATGDTPKTLGTEQNPAGSEDADILPYSPASRQGGVSPASRQAPEFARGGVGAGGDAAAVFVAGTRVAHDAGRGEDTPGAIAASSELSRQGETPLSAYGSMRRLSLPMSELVWLRNKLAGPFAPARLGVNADVFGIVDKTDMATIKAQLIEEGMFLCEDPEWVATHRASEVRDERKMSELALAGRLNDLADARVKGTAAGGQSAARSILADKVARVVLDLERPAPGVLGDVRTIAQVLVKNLSSSRKEALDNAAAFLDWTRGGGSSSREGAAADRAPKDIIADLFGAWLVMPAEVERRLPDWNKAIVDTIAGDKQLAEAFKELTVRSMTSQSVGHLMQQISASQSRAAEAALKKLDAEGTDPIQPASKLARAKEAVVIGFDDRLGAVSVRIDYRVRIYRASAREALANAKTEIPLQLIEPGLSDVEL